MADMWYISRNNIRYGPYSYDAMKEMASNGQLLVSDYVWSSAVKEWKTADKAKGLFEAKYIMKERNRYVKAVPKRKKGAVIGKLPIAAVIIIFAAIILITKLPYSKSVDELSCELDLNTYLTAELYREAVLQTARVLNSGPGDVSYDTWNSGLKETMDIWSMVEKQSSVMDKAADRLIKAVETENSKVGLNFIRNCRNASLIINCYADGNPNEIVAIYDKAPRGQKLKTLAKHLGVDAKMAFLQLKMANEQIKADTWNNLAEVEQKCEERLTYIKDASKAAVYTYGMAVTGGTATAFETAGAIISGADLVLEIGSDMSAIAFGDNHQGTVLLKDLRLLTEPAAALISFKGLFDLGKNIGKVNEYTKLLEDIKEMKGLSKANALKTFFTNKLSTNMFSAANTICFAGEQFGGYLSENKVLGIKLDDKDQKAALEEISKEKASEILNNIKDEVNTAELVLEEKEKPVSNTQPEAEVSYPENEVKTEKAEPNSTANASDIVGKWRGTNFIDFSFNIKGPIADEFIPILEFRSDGTFRTYNESAYAKNPKLTLILKGTYYFDGNTFIIEYDDYEVNEAYDIKTKLEGNKLYVANRARAGINGETVELGALYIRLE